MRAAVTETVFNLHFMHFYCSMLFSSSLPLPIGAKLLSPAAQKWKAVLWKPLRIFF
jgi:hypothetical protein